MFDLILLCHLAQDLNVLTDVTETNVLKARWTFVHYTNIPASNIYEFN